MSEVDNILAAIILAVEKDIEGDKMSKGRYKIFSESREQRIARFTATKKNSKKKIIQARYKKPELTEELKAEIFQKNRLACIKKFTAWLDGENSPLKEDSELYRTWSGWTYTKNTLPAKIILELLADKDLYKKYMEI